MHLHFYKYQGTGNDFILIDNRNQQLQDELSQPDIAHLCDRRFGIGADGLILLSDPRDSDFRMLYYNSDGNESSMCGNGGRCLVAFAHRMGVFEGNSCVFEAVDGLHAAMLYEDGRVELEMIRPQGYQSRGPSISWMDTGSPHFVQFFPTPVDALDVYAMGKEVRYSAEYQPIGGTNANFAHVKGENELAVRTYERGVEAETLSCGTGVTAAAYAYLRQQFPKISEDLPAQTVKVETPGGMLQVRVEHFRGKKESVRLIGPATSVFEGDIHL